MCWLPKPLTRALLAASLLAVPLRADAQLSTGLLAFWELGESAGSTRVDSLATYDLTDTNTVGQATGKVGSAASFDASATNQRLVNAGAAGTALNVVGDWTLAVWIYEASNTGTFETIATIAGNGFELRLDGGDTPNFLMDGPSGNASWGSTLSLTTWYYLVCWYDNTAHTINIQVNNGTPVSVSYTRTTAGGFSDLVIGGRSGASLPFDGRVDQLGIWNVVKSASDRTALYNSGAGLSYAAMSAVASSGGSLSLLGVGK